MLRKFNNYPPDDDSLPCSKWRKTRQGIVTAIVVLSLTIAGYFLFTFHPLLRSTYSRIYQNLQVNLLNFLERKGEDHAIFQKVKEIIPASGNSPAPADNSFPDKSAEEFHYTVELTNGGRIEGRTLKIGERTITVTDDSGVEVQVAKGRVSRISKRSLR